MNTFYCARYYVTYRCNSKCSFCDIHSRQATDELDLDAGKNLIFRLYQLGVRYIDFTGGEPLLNENLFELVLYAKSLGIKTEVTTNGIPFGENYFERVKKAAIAADKFNISLDTLCSETYRKIRGVDRLPDVQETVELLSAAATFKIMCVVTKDNIDQLNELILFAQKNKVQIYFNPEFVYFNKKRGSIPNTKTIVSRVYDDYTVVLLHFMEFIATGDTFPPCSANKQTITLSPDGRIIVPCYHMQKDLLKTSESFDNAVDSEMMAYYQNASGKLSCCKNCVIVPYMGISFNLTLNHYFILQSYSEKLKLLKQNFTNELSGKLAFDKDDLLLQMKELIEIANSMGGNLPSEANSKDINCWKLKCVPHYFYDFILNTAYPKLKTLYKNNTISQRNYYRIFSDAFEFQLRLWKYYLSVYMNSKIVCDIEEHSEWLKQYLQHLSICFHDDGEAASAVAHVNSLIIKKEKCYEG